MQKRRRPEQRGKPQDPALMREFYSAAARVFDRAAKRGIEVAHKSTKQVGRAPWKK